MSGRNQYQSVTSTGIDAARVAELPGHTREGGWIAHARVGALMLASFACCNVSAQPHSILVKEGEHALLGGETERAGALFEQAASINHAAQPEVGLIRTYMQRGEYRRAIAFAAHTAGAHPEASAGCGLYAWLLHVGGQAQAAALTLARARLRLPKDSLLLAIEASLKSLAALPGLAPADQLFGPVSPGSATIPKTAQVLGSGVLANQGRTVLAPADNVAASQQLWVRDGLGRVTAARLAKRFGQSGVVELEVATPFATTEDGSQIQVAGRDPFPGSAGYLVEFASSNDAAPSWPALHLGFIGQLAPDEGRYKLGINAPGAARGGPVFDSAGRWIGMSIKGAGREDRLVVISELQRLGAIAADGSALERARPMPVDEVYERALRVTVQLIGAASSE